MEKHPDELLSAYLDHELTYDEQLAVEDHLSTCIHCQTLLEELSSIKKQLFSAYQTLEIPNDFEEKLMLTIEKREVAKIVSEKKIWIGIVIGILLGSMLLILLPYTSFSFNLLTSIIKVLFSVIQTLPTIFSFIPFLVEGFLVFATILVAISIWSLRKLLQTKALG
ncbi:anti-sigma factor [Tepidibacillus infernus]|uniref:anti-sigma factor family protein n=1 Tax=Tepidibacillus infernus TaxID=1806172 RepID=UPI003B7311F8